MRGLGRIGALPAAGGSAAATEVYELLYTCYLLLGRHHFLNSPLQFINTLYQFVNAL